ncbi:MAG: NAD(P)-dependent oxidoreductase [Leptonema sp. (in: Bacteria)]|nr:NAD(P)-dependent oxidoreductase [Leptonema sp. (in: bacteria)]
MKTIAMIGVGIMGRGLTLNLKKAGHRLKLYTRSPNKVQNLIDEKCSLHSTIQEATQSVDLVILCLTDDEVVHHAFFNEHLLENRPPIIIDTGTTSPDLTLTMYQSAKDANISFLDSPMTGSKLAAESGQILFLVGGDVSVYESLDYFYKACGKNSVHCGPISSGQRAKIALNMIQAGMLQVYLEGFHLASKDGISSTTMIDLLMQSAAASPLLDFKLKSVLTENYEAHFALKNMNKDMNHAMNRAKQNHASLPLSSTLKSIYDAAMAAGYSELDFCSLAKIMSELNQNKLT